MKWQFICVVVFLLSCFTRSVFSDELPNVVLILADDLGFSDLGCYGGEISTPNLDRLASNGLRYSQFYNTGRCWPTRASLLTGYYAQQIRRDKIPGLNPKFKTGGQGKRPDWAPLITTTMQKAEYRCYHSGKWHLDGGPLASGFAHSYSLNDHGRFFSPQRHSKDGKSLPKVKRDSGYYATTAIANHAIECLSEHLAQHDSKPFFSFIAFTAPHFPLHALPEDIQKYQEAYNNGWNEIRNRRWKQIKSLDVMQGVISKAEADLGPPYDFPDDLETLGPGEINRPIDWDELNETQKQFQAIKMAIHAAMVDRMDQEIGRIITQLERMDALENTLIIFLSDNGASSEIMVRDDGHDRTAPMGSAASHLCLGPGWSTACNTPFRKHKTWVHEGGIATPMIVHWPNAIPSKGEWRHQVGHVIDFVPTLIEICKLDLQKQDGEPELPGKSLVESFAKNLTIERELWWAHDGHQAVRTGDWKLVNSKNESWELFDLSTDRAETNNLITEQPELAEKLINRWNQLAEQFAKQAEGD